MIKRASSTFIALLLAAGCGDPQTGPEGPPGEDGDHGQDGEDGENGQNGNDGQDGEDGEGGGACRAAILGDGDIEGVPTGPLSSVVALSFCDAAQTDATNVADYVKILVQRYHDGTLPAGYQFPLAAAATDQVRAIEGLVPDVVVRWLDPLSWSAEPSAPRFGSHADFIGYLGEDWQGAGGSAIYGGSDTEGWLWVNHEYVSNDRPGTTAPTGQHRMLARFLGYWGVIDLALATTGSWDPASISTYIHEWKRQVGGSWIHVIQDPATGDWQVDRSATAVRYDATDSTQLLVTGQTVGIDHDDTGAPLPGNVVVGIQGDCAGQVTPWGTIITAEENVDVAYGDLEPVWSSDQRLTASASNNPTFLAGNTIVFPFGASTTGDFSYNPDPAAVHDRDINGYLTEMDPGVAPDEYYGRTTYGVGHQKLGAIGRARWETAAFVLGDDWDLIPGQPLVMYAANDRRGGHIYKWVSAQPYADGMTRAEIRDLLADGTLHVAQFEDLDQATGKTLVGGEVPTEALPGSGRWVELSLTSTDLAPNAAALGDASKTVGAALADVDWNRLGGFATDDDVRRALFTASLKIGARELNRPEDLEWNPRDPSGVPRLYVAFTNHNRKVAADQEGRIFDPATHGAQSPARTDRTGWIAVIEEENPSAPASSDEFTFFAVWTGSQGTDDFDAASPDNLLIDADGGVWFGTDGNMTVNQRGDAVYYLDLDSGKGFRVAAAPSDGEATGPTFSAGMGTLFFAVQHPGEDIISTWPPR